MNNGFEQTLLNTLASLCALDAQAQFTVAYSGGVDSHVLLYALAQLRREQKIIHLSAIHIHHGLSPNATAWAQHAQAFCEQQQIPLHIEYVQVEHHRGESLEACAREARYAALKKMMTANMYLLMGHHSDDQAETVLLQLLRGAGIAGLAAMPETTSLGLGVLIRPLLDCTRAEIVNYAKENFLTWIEDESNANNQFDRNFLRNTIIPQLKSHWPSLHKTIARSAQHCSEALFITNEIAAHDLKNCLSQPGSRLNLLQLKQLPAERMHSVLRFYLKQHNVIPSELQFREIQAQFLGATADAQPRMVINDHEIRRYLQHLYVIKPKSKILRNFSLEWNLQEPLVLPNDLGILTCTPPLSDNLQVTVRFRQGGERFHPKGRVGSHPLKKLMQEWHIPPWEREVIPLIYLGDECIAIPNYAVSTHCPKIIPVITHTCESII